MIKEYRIAKGWALFIYIFIPVMIAVCLMPFFFVTDMTASDYWIFGPVCGGVIILMILGILDTVKGKFVIDHDRIWTEGVFSNRQLLFDEIKGYRKLEKQMVIEPHDPYKKKIKISSYLGKYDEIAVWLSGHYPDLDIQDAELEKEKVLASEDFGSTIEEREENLLKAKKAANILNGTAMALGMWTIFFPKPYEYAILASIAFPIVCIVVLNYFKGLIKINQRKDSAFPSILVAILISGLGLCCRAIFDYSIFSYEKLWLAVILLTLVYTIVLLVSSKEFKSKKGKDVAVVVIALLMFTFSYSYGAVVALNCMYDNDGAELFEARVLNKRISSGKTTTYYIELTPWGPQKETDEVSVSRNLYERLGKDDDVKVYFMKGRFGIPWFEVAE